MGFLGLGKSGGGLFGKEGLFAGLDAERLRDILTTLPAGADGDLSALAQFRQRRAESSAQRDAAAAEEADWRGAQTEKLGATGLRLAAGSGIERSRLIPMKLESVPMRLSPNDGPWPGMHSPGPFSRGDLDTDQHRGMAPLAPDMVARIPADISRNAADRAAELGLEKSRASMAVDAQRPVENSRSEPSQIGFDGYETPQGPRESRPPTGAELWSPTNPRGRHVPPGYHVHLRGDDEPEVQFTDEQLAQVIGHIPAASRSAADLGTAARELDRFVAALPGNYFGGPHRIQDSAGLIQQYRQLGARGLPRTQSPIPLPDISDARQGSETRSASPLERSDAVMRNVANSMTLGATDRLAGALDAAVEDPLGLMRSALPGIYGYDREFGQRVDNNIRRQHAITNYDWQHYPVESVTGSLLGNAGGVSTRVPVVMRSAASAARREGLSRPMAIATARGAAADRMALEGTAAGAIQGFNSSDGDLSDRFANAAVEGAYGGPLGYGTARYAPGRFGHGEARVPIGWGRTVSPEQIEMARAGQELDMTIPGYVARGPLIRRVTDVVAKLPYLGQAIRRAGNDLEGDGRQAISRIAGEGGEYAGDLLRRGTLALSPEVSRAQRERVDFIERLGRSADGRNSFSFESFLANWNNLSPYERVSLGLSSTAALNKLATVSRGVVRGGGTRSGSTDSAPGRIGAIASAIGTAFDMYHNPHHIPYYGAGGAAAGALTGAGNLLASPAFTRRLAETPMQLRAAATYWSRPWVAKLARANPLIAADLLNFQQTFLRELSTSDRSTVR